MNKPLKSADRREFLKTGGAVAAGLLTQAMPARAAAGTGLAELPVNPRTQASMPTRNLGKTGYKGAGAWTAVDVVDAADG
jgi:uncharacterized protein